MLKRLLSFFEKLRLGFSEEIIISWNEFHLNLRLNVDLLRFVARRIVYADGVSSISKPPGHRFISALKFIYSKKTYERIFEQVVLDMRDEHAEALLAKRTWHARWIHVRGIIILFATMAAHLVSASGKTVAKIWKLTP